MKPRVAVVSFPWKSHSPYKFLSDLFTILEPISDKIVLINGNTDRIDTAHGSKIVVWDIGIGMHYLGDIKPKYYSAVIWLLKWLLIQYRASVELVRVRKDIDLVLFYVACPGYLLLLIATKLLPKKEHRNRYAQQIQRYDGPITELARSDPVHSFGWNISGIERLDQRTWLKKIRAESPS